MSVETLYYAVFKVSKLFSACWQSNCEVWLSHPQKWGEFEVFLWVGINRYTT